MGWQTIPEWAASLTPPITRQRAFVIFPRIPAAARKYGPKGGMVKEGTPKPEDLAPGRPKKVT